MIISSNNSPTDIIDAIEAAARQASAAATPGMSRADRHLSEFARRCPAAAAWIARTMGTFDFARSMYAAVIRYGDLTPKQAAAVERCLARDAAPRPAGATLDEGSVAALRACFDRAAAAQCHGAKLRLALTKPDPAQPGKTVCVAAFAVSAAPLNGKNPGALYVKDGADGYLGKVTGTRFSPSRECTPAVAEHFVRLCADPETAAVAYSRHYRRCSVCHAILSDPKSVAEGIGPVCRQKFGWR